ncbi:NAD(P)-binding protein [Peniophora sp. CONT]|nr:NAD(P)-binding protein [Peniophora sp. CONT]
MSFSDLLVLTATDVTKLLSSFAAPALLAQSARLFYALAHASTEDPIQQPHRTTLPLPAHKTLVMPARVPGVGASLKLVSVPTGQGDTRGLPASTLVLDEETGAVRAVLNARALTAVRTAAGTVLATTILHKPETSKFKRIVAFGAGAQIKAHVDLLCAVYKNIEHVTIVARSKSSRTEDLAAYLRSSTSRSVNIVLSSDESTLHAALGTASIIVTATPSTTPLFPSSAVPSGAHLILVGSWRPDMHEIDTDLVNRAGRIVLDSREACATEAGELIKAGVDFSRTVELGELVQEVEGDKVISNEDLAKEVLQSGEVTLVKSVGVGGQDVAIAKAVADLAEKMGGIGTVVHGYDAA